MRSSICRSHLAAIWHAARSCRHRHCRGPAVQVVLRIVRRTAAVLRVPSPQRSGPTCRRTWTGTSTRPCLADHRKACSALRPSGAPGIRDRTRRDRAAKPNDLLGKRDPSLRTNGGSLLGKGDRKFTLKANYLGEHNQNERFKYLVLTRKAHKQFEWFKLWMWFRQLLMEKKTPCSCSHSIHSQTPTLPDQ